MHGKSNVTETKSYQKHHDNVIWAWAPVVRSMVKIAQNSLYQMHPLFEKIFSPPATSAPVERI